MEKETIAKLNKSFEDYAYEQGCRVKIFEVHFNQFLIEGIVHPNPLPKTKIIV